MAGVKTSFMGGHHRQFNEAGAVEHLVDSQSRPPGPVEVREAVSNKDAPLACASHSPPLCSETHSYVVRLPKVECRLCTPTQMTKVKD
jgi:hypothetical protein